MRPATARALRQPNAQAAARRLGEQGAQRAIHLAEHKDPEFGAKAYDFIVRHIRLQRRPVSSEDVTLACREAGITAPYDRAFGAIYAKAIRDGQIKPVGFCLRKRGHGTAGGRLYSAGSGKPAKRVTKPRARRAG